jgi:hypothetical protein
LQERKDDMPQKNTTPAVKNDETTTRVTSARSFYRTLPAQNRVMLVPANADPLLDKESDCCSRATD